MGERFPTVAPPSKVVRQKVGKRRDPDGLDFAGLREASITLAQQLSGKIWTDYNLHDPGVTILEQMCFGLSELAYQSGLGVGAHLSDQHGVIDFAKYSLFKPHEILPNKAVTLRDYCKLFIDAIPEIDAVHLVPVGKGIFDIHLKLQQKLTASDDTMTEARQQQLKAQARQVFMANRNLGEDLNEIILVQSNPCFLQANIEIGGRRGRADITADILFQCARLISSNIRIERYEEAYRDNADLAQLFDGPLTHRGYIHNRYLIPADGHAEQDLNSLVAAIAGVKHIYDLKLVDADGKPIDEKSLQERAYHLQLPQTQEQLALLIISNAAGNSREKYEQLPEAVLLEKNKKLMAEVRRYLQRLEFEYNAFRSNKSQAGSFYPLPAGRPRAPLSYYSVQHHFPNIYGVNAAGVPSAESSERKLLAKQLKAYLYPVEQVMANFLQQIQELHRLFYAGDVHRQSYFSRYLDNRQMPQIESLYTAKSELNVQLVRARYDNYSERKNRALDSLLAMYGEVFPEDQLLHFDDYHRGAADYWMIDNKIHFITHIVSLSGARAQAFNQTQPHWLSDNISIAQKKINILLGLRQVTNSKSFTSVANDFHIKVVSSDQLLQKSAHHNLADLPTQPLPELGDSQQRALENWQYQPGKTISMSDDMARAAVYLSNFRLLVNGEHMDVYLQLPVQQKLVLLKSARSLNEALSYAHKFKKIASLFNQESEGFHLIEHLLLRPRPPLGAAAQAAEDKPCGPDPFTNNFFDHQLSLVFPNWTARAINPAFRQYVRQLVNQHMPAHLLPEIYWLDRVDMASFEALYQEWLAALLEYQQALLKDDGAMRERVNQTAQQLAQWLHQHRQPQEYWV
jgi:hypothetical protein